MLVNRALGHRDVRTTQRYVHVDDRRLVRALNRLRLDGEVDQALHRIEVTTSSKMWAQGALP